METLVARHTDEQGSEVRLTCPAVGSFRSCHEPGESLEPGAILGILSVLNFAPSVVQVPDHVDLRQVDLATELRILGYHQHRRMASGTTARVAG